MVARISRRRRAVGVHGARTTKARWSRRGRCICGRRDRARCAVAELRVIGDLGGGAAIDACAARRAARRRPAGARRGAVRATKAGTCSRCRCASCARHRADRARWPSSAATASIAASWRARAYARSAARRRVGRVRAHAAAAARRRRRRLRDAPRCRPHGLDELLAPAAQGVGGARGGQPGGRSAGGGVPARDGAGAARGAASCALGLVARRRARAPSPPISWCATAIAHVQLLRGADPEHAPAGVAEQLTLGLGRGGGAGGRAPVRVRRRRAPLARRAQARVSGCGCGTRPRRGGCIAASRAHGRGARSIPGGAQGRAHRTPSGAWRAFDARRRRPTWCSAPSRAWPPTRRCTSIAASCSRATCARPAI